MRARMPAMINRLMPLPMPNSSICSPSHIRNMVPAVMVNIDASFQCQTSWPEAFSKADATSPCGSTNDST